MSLAVFTIKQPALLAPCSRRVSLMALPSPASSSSVQSASPSTEPMRGQPITPPDAACRRPTKQVYLIARAANT